MSNQALKRRQEDDNAPRKRPCTFVDCPEPRRLVMVKLECHFESCTRKGLNETTSDFVPNGLFGLFYCDKCGHGREDEIRAKVRNANGFGYCLPAETICPTDQIKDFFLRVKRSNGDFEDDWTLFPWPRFQTYGCQSGPPLEMRDDIIYAVVTKTFEDGFKYTKSCFLSELLEWNPKWKPKLDLSAETDLSEKHVKAWHETWNKIS